MKKASSSSILLWGRHVVMAVLHNPHRHVECVYVTQKDHGLKTQRCPIHVVTPEYLSKQVPHGAVHQNIAVRTVPLKSPDLEDLDPARGMVLLLDGVVDPHNVGALWRSAAVFGAQALVVTKDHCPPLEGVVSKSACGASELVPCISVTNLVRSMDILQKKGFFCIGLAEEGEKSLEKLDLWPLAFVIGSEGSGLRRLVRKQCDCLVSISSSSAFSTLNASVAGALALQEGYRIGVRMGKKV
jgi:23S rRNA (guanosine2251-2'-O)-methyltransferase